MPFLCCTKAKIIFYITPNISYYDSFLCWNNSTFTVCVWNLYRIYFITYVILDYWIYKPFTWSYFTIFINIYLKLLIFRIIRKSNDSLVFLLQPSFVFQLLLPCGKLLVTERGGTPGHPAATPCGNAAPDTSGTPRGGTRDGTRYAGRYSGRYSARGAARGAAAGAGSWGAGS